MLNLSRSLVPIILFAVLYFGGARGGGIQFTPVCWLRFTAELRAGSQPGTTEIRIIVSLEEDGICRDTHMVRHLFPLILPINPSLQLDPQLDWSRSGLRPLLQISTCHTGGSGLVNDTIAHTLISTLEQIAPIDTSSMS